MRLATLIDRPSPRLVASTVCGQPALADGLVRRRHTLWVVRNFSRRLWTLRLDHDGRSAGLVVDRATDPVRVLTAAELTGGRLRAVDNHCDGPVSRRPYVLATLAVRR
jgi:hypothetical protein